MSEKLSFSGMAIYFPANERQEGADEPEKDENVGSDYVRIDTTVSVPYEIVSVESDGSATFKVLNISGVTRSNETKDQITEKMESSKKENSPTAKGDVKDAKGAEGTEDSKEDKKLDYERRLGYIGRIGVETFSVSSLSGATILLGPSQCRSLEEDQKKSPDDKLQVLEGEEIDIRERLRNMTITPLSFVSNPYRSESFGIDVDIVEETTGEESGVTSGRVACYFDDHGNIAGEINIQERPRNVSNGRRLGKSQIA